MIKIENKIFRDTKQESVPESKDIVITLTDTEYKILQYFVENKNKRISFKDIVAEVWGEYTYFNKRILDVYICKLRKFLIGQNCIVTLHTYGYMYVSRD